MTRSRQPFLSLAAIGTLSSGCGANSPAATVEQALEIECSIPVSEIHRGARRGAIPALTNPILEFWGGEETTYLRVEDRVVGIVLDGQAIAIPLNIFWWHEIVNLDAGDRQIAVTHCPLTGSSLAFDRSPVGGAEFDVSGLLYENNLVMFDRSGESESLWPQMGRRARCGPKDGTDLPMVPVVEMTWGGWLSMHPDSKVVTSDTGYSRDYTEYPYDDYDDIDNPYTLFPGASSIDPRRPPKERGLGVPDSDGGLVFPYGELSELGLTGVVHESSSDGDYVVFWSGPGQGAAAFRPVADGQTLTFRTQSGRFVDDQTGSEWKMDGRAIDGPLTGTTLEPVAEAFVAFWFAWPAFYPRIDVWTRP